MIAPVYPDISTRGASNIPHQIFVRILAQGDGVNFSTRGDNGPPHVVPVRRGVLHAVAEENHPPLVISVAIRVEDVLAEAQTVADGGSGCRGEDVDSGLGRCPHTGRVVLVRHCGQRVFQPSAGAETHHPQFIILLYDIGEETGRGFGRVHLVEVPHAATAIDDQDLVLRSEIVDNSIRLSVVDAKCGWPEVDSKVKRVAQTGARLSRGLDNQPVLVLNVATVEDGGRIAAHSYGEVAAPVQSSHVSACPGRACHL